jgi:uncharacterized integral membrane protein
MRILVTLVAIGCLAILVLSNLSPPIAVTFFSRQTIALPLGLWLLGAIVVGFSSSVAVQFLVSFQQRRLLTRLRQLERELDRSSEPELNFRSTNPALDDDWGDAPSPRAEEEEDIYPEEEEDIYPEDDDEYPEPDSRGEVVDAGFRVIRPPETDEPPLRYTPPTDRSTSRDGEDWGFDFDEDEDDRSSTRRQR